MVRLSALGFALAAASVLVPGVLSQVPACATSCETQAAAAAGCKLTDTNCLCNGPTFPVDSGICVKSTCAPGANYTAAVNYFEGLCGASSNTTSSGTTTGTLPTTTTTGGTSTKTTTSSSKPNHATRDQPAGVLGAGLALALALFA